MLLDFAVGNGLGLLGVAETWLLEDVPDSFVSLSGYAMVRCDSVGAVRKHGVCLYIRRDIKFRVLQCECANTCGVHLVDFNVYVAVVYRPPSYGLDENAAICDFLCDFCESREVVVLGDFNLPSVPWDDDNLSAVNLPPLQRSFLDCFSSLGLTQWVRSPTFLYSDNVLDLILTSEGDRLGDVTVHPALPCCDHCPLSFSYFFLDPVDLSICGGIRRAWHRGNYVEIERYLIDVDWGYEFSDLSVEDMVGRFSSLLFPLIDMYIPVAKPNLCQTLFKPPRELVRARSTSWAHYKNIRSVHGRRSREATAALASFQEINCSFRGFYNREVISYEQSVAADLKTNSKLFHKYIRSKKVGNPSVGPLKSGSQFVTGCEEMAEILADGFSSVYSTQDLVNPFPHQLGMVDGGGLESVSITVDSVRRVLSSLDVNSSMGPDGVHPCILKHCPSLAVPLCLIFERSLRSGVVPPQWKFSEIVPLFKKGSRSDPLNYRPISLTSVCCKSLEKIVASCLMNFLEEHSLLSRDQFGFRSGRAVEDQLLLVYNDVTTWLDSGYTVDLVLFDFSKAFDVVSHGILMDKLAMLGIGGRLHGWIGDFLADRQMCVSVSGIQSSNRPVLSGVPQGSVLGPLLFIVFINSLPSCVLNKCKMFADDMKIYLKVARTDIRRIAENLSSCQRDIDVLQRVATSWGLRFNVGKCEVLRFGRGSSDLMSVGSLSVYNMDGSDLTLGDSSRDLGVLVDSSLRFHTHVRQVVSRAWGLASNLLRSTLCRSREFMLNVYVAHIRPLLEFSSPVWNTGFVGDGKLLESVQRRWTKKVWGLEHLDYASRLESLSLYSVRGRLLRADLIKYFKIFNGLSAISPVDLFVLSPMIHTRGHRYKICKPRASLELRRRFFSVRCVDAWNSLPDGLVSCGSVAAFKSGLHAHLGAGLFEFDH